MSTPNLSSELHEYERVIYESPDSHMQRIATDLLVECRRLQHELADPNYLYSGRIPRGAILSRDAEIDRLRGEIKALQEKIDAIAKSG